MTAAGETPMAQRRRAAGYLGRRRVKCATCLAYTPDRRRCALHGFRVAREGFCPSYRFEAPDSTDIQA